MSIATSTVEFLESKGLVITTAESCTAGKIITLLSQIEGSGSFIDSGYIVYSPEAKQRLLKVRPYTIETFNLTSCEVAREMAQGALCDSAADVAVATTGILGPDDVDGIPAGTICFAWAYRAPQGLCLFSRKERFIGSREQVQMYAAEYALKCLPYFYDRAWAGERG
ncbi:CinA family protein [Pseudomonas palleroniana]|uniref:CinA family protein n=1 Tax=Pseudomonas palleroniana TaxID=191390 RepID=UPI001FCA6A36|nr:CinA family protein [Pseudomonas palleroniana]UOK36103.1 CinA family protein [Pseudomonas palleroniana]